MYIAIHEVYFNGVVHIACTQTSVHKLYSRLTFMCCHHLSPSNSTFQYQNNTIAQGKLLYNKNCNMLNIHITLVICRFHVAWFFQSLHQVLLKLAICQLFQLYALIIQLNKLSTLIKEIILSGTQSQLYSLLKEQSRARGQQLYAHKGNEIHCIFSDHRNPQSQLPSPFTLFIGLGSQLVSSTSNIHSLSFLAALTDIYPFKCFFVECHIQTHELTLELREQMS